MGGVLQGMEAAYLARKAGYETVVVDRWADAPALSLADEAVVLDVVEKADEARRLFADCDAVLPANEDLRTLTALDRMFRTMDVPLLFDLKAYQTSSSKLLSNRLMERLGVPTPRPWPECGYPAVVKPSGQSGSTGVVKACTPEDMEKGLQRIREMGDEAVVQEFVDGPNISIEVIGDGERALPLVLTEVVLDDVYDCKMVLCPVPGLGPEVAEAFRGHGRALAEGLSLRGVMDVEAIVHLGVAKVLEIDARLPSQTPAAVLNATGVNLVEVLAEALAGDGLPDDLPVRQGAAVYEHVAVDGHRMRSCGECSLSQMRRPRLERGLFGADEAITDFDPGKERWYATLICTGSTAEEAWAKHQSCLRQMIESNDITQYVDLAPEMRA